MPRIAEIKQIGGQVWVRIPHEEVNSPITLYTAEELEVYARGVRLELINEIEELMTELRRRIAHD